MLIFINQIFAKWSRSHVSEQDALRNGTKHRACQRSLSRVQACPSELSFQRAFPQPSWTCYSPPVFLCPAVYCSELTLSLTQSLLTEFRFTQDFIRIIFGFPALPKEDSSEFREQLTLHCSALLMAQLPTAQCRTSHLCHSKQAPNTLYHSHMDRVIRSSRAWKNPDNSPSPSGQRHSVTTCPAHPPYLQNWSVAVQQELSRAQFGLGMAGAISHPQLRGQGQRGQALKRFLQVSKQAPHPAH